MINSEENIFNDRDSAQGVIKHFLYYSFSLLFRLVKHAYDSNKHRNIKHRLRRLIVPLDSTGILQQHAEHHSDIKHPRNTKLFRPFAIDYLKIYNTFASE